MGKILGRGLTVGVGSLENSFLETLKPGVRQVTSVEVGR